MGAHILHVPCNTCKVSNVLAYKADSERKEGEFKNGESVSFDEKKRAKSEKMRNACAVSSLSLLFPRFANF